MLNRSLERDYDINYHTRSFREKLAAIAQDIEILHSVGHDPSELLVEMGEMCTTLIGKHAHI